MISTPRTGDREIWFSPLPESILPPQTMELLWQLRLQGFDLPLDALSVEECADRLEALLRA